MIKFVLLLLCFLLVSCSKNGPTSNAKLEITNAFVFSGQAGGVMLYIVNKDQNLQRSIALESNKVVIPLINGNWEFTVLAWDGANPLTGNLKCAQESVLLNDDTVEVNLSLTAQACDQDFISPATFRAGGTIKPLRLVNCLDTIGLAAGSSCDSGNRGYASSYKVKLLAHPDQSLSSLSAINFASSKGLITDCISAISSPMSITNTALKIPFGSTYFNPPVVLEAYDDVACSTGKKEFFYPNGLNATETTNNISATFPTVGFGDVFMEYGKFSVSGATNFGTVVAEMISQPQTLTINNMTSSPMTSISMTLPAPFAFAGGTFPGTAGTCATSLAKLTTCTVVIEARPLATGSLSGTLSISYLNNLNQAQTQTVALTVTGYDMVVTNGEINAMAKVGNTLYIGGVFSNVGPRSGGGLMLKKSGCTGESCLISNYSSLLSMPKVSGEVYASVSDGNGGYFIGGHFTFVGKYSRKNLAHILSDGSVDASFDPEVNGDVLSLLLDGTTLYVGGTFTSIDMQTRNKIASIDTTNASLLSWNPNCSSGTAVYAMALSGSTLYVGGSFFNIGGQPRSHIAGLDTSSGSATSLNFTLNQPVYALAIDGNKLYVGGDFSTFNVSRDRLAVVDISTSAGSLETFNVGSPSGAIQSILIDGSNLYVAGTFSMFAGSTRYGLASYHLGNNALNSFNPSTSAGSMVYSLHLSGSTLYAGGAFSTMGGQTRKNLAAIDTNTGSATSFDPNINSAVKFISGDNNSIYAGGYFSSMGNWSARNNFASIDTTTGLLTSFNPNPTGVINSLVFDGSNTLYVGGGFTFIAGQSRSRLASFDTSNNSLKAFNIVVNSTINSLIVSGSTLYIGGQFTNVGGQTRNNLAAIDTTIPSVLTFNPNVNGLINAMVLNGSTLYIGGNFTIAGGQSRGKLAVIDTTNGSATAFNVTTAPNNQVLSLALNGTTLYAGGPFNSIGGYTRRGLAAINTGSGIVDSGFDPVGAGTATVYALTVYGTDLYIGGLFGTIDSLPRSGIAAVDTSTGAATNFAHDLLGEARTFLIDGTRLYIGGQFSNANGYARSGLGFAELP